jgi:hypothetical protein
VHINVVCPRCKTAYQVLDSLIGKAIRCPNNLCRMVFRIGAVPGNAPAGLPPASTPGSPHVGDMLEVVQGDILEEATEKPAKPKPADAPDWATAPPAVRKPVAPGTTPPSSAPPPKPRPAADSGPSWRDAPPPVRQPDANATVRRRKPSADPNDTVRVRKQPGAADTVVPVSRPPEPPPRGPGQDTLNDTTGQALDLSPDLWEPPADSAPPPEAAAPRVSRRRALLVMSVLVGFVGAILGAAGYLWSLWNRENEVDLVAQAQKDLEERRFGNAAEDYAHLRKQFSDSDKLPTYTFLEDWARLAARLHDPQADPSALDALDAFLESHKDDPNLKDQARNVGIALVQFADTFARHNANPSDDKPLAVAAQLDKVRGRLKAAAGKEALQASDEERITADLRGVRQAVEHWQQRSAVLAQLQSLPASADGIREARRLIRDKSSEFPGLADAPEVTQLVERLYQGHLESVKYEPGGDPGHVPPRKGPTESSIIFDPLLAGTPGVSRADDGTVLAVARGLLYGLNQRTGTVKWCRRVGIDTTALPVIVPDEARKERILALSSDSATLTALDADGGWLWEYHLEKPCLGRPLVVQGKAFVATFDGVVHEIDLAAGKLVGRYRLGQNLTVGGAQEPDSPRLYFPAENSCVYVLDVLQHTCPLILYTDHPSGSLRSEPLIIPSVTLGGAEEPGYLVLNQTESLDAIRLRVYQLPLTDRRQEERKLDAEPRLAGWTWFRPAMDAEKVVALSDQGELGLFGIRQPKNNDPALFPLLSPSASSLDGLLPRMPQRGRAQVVQMQGNDFWVLANGGLQRLAMALSGETGPRLVPGWREVLPLGSPLHEAQVIENPGSGTATLFLVTQPLRQPTCVATAVEDSDGHILWQRQLGLVSRGEPLRLNLPSDKGKIPMFLCLDQSGSVFALDPDVFTAKGQPWQGSGQSLAGSLNENPQVAPLLLPGPDDTSAVELACPGDGSKLVVRLIDWTHEGRRLVSNQREVPVTSPLAGTPAIVDGTLVVPLAGRDLARLPLPMPLDVKPESGPDWRSRVAPSGVPGHVLSLGGDRFLTTDGGRGLNCWSWPKGKTYEPLGVIRGKTATLELPDRVVGAPILLPAPTGTPLRVCVADSAGALTLLGVQDDGRLEILQRWPLRAAVTAGPFARELPGGEVRIGCVVENRRLVWLDPAQAKPVWEYKAEGGAVAGLPQLVEGLLIVADEAGWIKALDPREGKPVGPGYRLAGSVVPTASPIAFGPRCLLAPLSDGTALLLEPDKLLGKKE